MAETFNKFFIIIAKNLRINENLLPTSLSETRNAESIIAKFDKNCSIFFFKEIVKTEVIKRRKLKTLILRKDRSLAIFPLG